MTRTVMPGVLNVRVAHVAQSIVLKLDLLVGPDHMLIVEFDQSTVPYNRPSRFDPYSEKLLDLCRFDVPQHDLNLSDDYRIAPTVPYLERCANGDAVLEFNVSITAHQGGPTTTAAAIVDLQCDDGDNQRHRRQEYRGDDLGGNEHCWIRAEQPFHHPWETGTGRRSTKLWDNPPST